MKSIERIARPLMGGEDFSRYLQHATGAMFFLGVGGEKKAANYGWHHPKFNPDEAAIRYGAAILAQAAIQFLNE
jgi:amidohydrolase